MDLKTLSETVTPDQRKALQTDVVIDNNLVLQSAEYLRTSFIVRLENAQSKEDVQKVFEDIDNLESSIESFDDSLREISSVAIDLLDGDNG